MTPAVEAAAAPLCDVRPGHPGYCLIHRHVVAPGHVLCTPVERVVARIATAVKETP